MVASFTVIDVETANADLASICQIGVAHFAEGVLSDSWGSLINPEMAFSRHHVAIHGIDEASVAGAPVFRRMAGELIRRLSGTIVVSHTLFDRTSLQRASALHGVALPESPWLDSTRVVRQVWPEFRERGYGLRNVANTLGIEFGHHDALQDAQVAGEVLVRACGLSGCDVADWLKREVRSSERRYGIAREPRDRIARNGNEEGPLYGETIVFTGALTMKREQAAAMAAQAGCNVADRVTTATTLLVVGDQDLRQTKGELKSAKHRRAEELIENGQSLRILQESDFVAMVAVA